MKKIPLLTILLSSGMVACSNSERASERWILYENNRRSQHDKNKELEKETISELDSTRHNTTHMFSESEQKQEKRKKNSATIEILTEDVQLDQKNHIVSGSVRNAFIKTGSTYFFKRVVKHDEDSRVGCSGSGNELSFTTINPADTFVIENEMLKTVNFQYRINGGLYWEDGKNPYKGYIKGILSPSNTWLIEINVWIKMTDLQLNKEMERHIIVNDEFTL